MKPINEMTPDETRDELALQRKAINRLLAFVAVVTAAVMLMWFLTTP